MHQDHGQMIINPNTGIVKSGFCCWLKVLYFHSVGEKGFFGDPISHLIRRYRIGPCELCPAFLRWGGGLRHDNVLFGGTPEHDDMGVSSCERISTMVGSAGGDASAGPSPRVP